MEHAGEPDLPQYHAVSARLSNSALGELGELGEPSPFLRDDMLAVRLLRPGPAALAAAFAVRLAGSEVLPLRRAGLPGPGVPPREGGLGGARLALRRVGLAWPSGLPLEGASGSTTLALRLERLEGDDFPGWAVPERERQQPDAPRHSTAHNCTDQGPATETPRLHSLTTQVAVHQLRSLVVVARSPPALFEGPYLRTDTASRPPTL